jgi:hypothetical protein
VFAAHQNRSTQPVEATASHANATTPNREVGGQQPGRLCPQERLPGRGGASWRRADPRRAEDPPDGSGADAVTEPDQLALDAAMAPRRILAGQPDHQFADLLVDRWAARPVRIRPLPPDQPAVPGQQRARVHDPVRPQLGGQQPGQCSQRGPIRPGQPRPRHLATQHRYLVPQHQDLGVLRRIGPRQQCQPAERLQQTEVRDPNHHGGRSSLTATSGKPAGRSLAPGSGTVQVESASAVTAPPLLANISTGPTPQHLDNGVHVVRLDAGAWSTRPASIRRGAVRLGLPERRGAYRWLGPQWQRARADAGRR